MLIETQKLAPLVAIFVVGLVSFPDEPTSPTASSAANSGAAGRKSFTPPPIAGDLRDPFERKAVASTRPSSAVPDAGPAPREVPFPSLPRMSGVILGLGSRVALFGRTAVAEGDSIRGVVVTHVDRKRVELLFLGKRWTLGLGEEVPQPILERGRPAMAPPAPRGPSPARGVL